MKILLYFLALVAIAVVFWWFPPVVALAAMVCMNLTVNELNKRSR